MQDTNIYVKSKAKLEKINVYVMIGLPGAGKDTWIREHLPDCKCIACRDDIRVELGLCGPTKSLPEPRNRKT